jgi:hypothetical protein
MARTTRRTSFVKGTITRENGELIIAEVLKDDTKVYNLDRAIDEYLGLEGVSVTISVDDVVPAEDD